MPPRPFRFGVQVRTPRTAGAWLDTARRVERLGYDTVTMFDHPTHGLGPLAMLAAAAVATERVRLGTFVLATDYRHPVLLAQEAATIDQLSGGRLELGLGAGWDRAEYTAIGIPFDPPGVRIGRLEHTVRLLKRLFAEEGVSADGAHGLPGVAELTLAARPVQRPHPPLLIGGGGPRVLGVAAREADIVALAPRALADGTLDPANITAGASAAKVATVRAAAGARFADLELNVYVYAVVVTADRAGAAARLAADFALPAADLLASPHALIGTEDEIVADLRARRDRYGIAYLTVGDDLADALAPIVARLAGT